MRQSPIYVLSIVLLHLLQFPCLSYLTAIPYRVISKPQPILVTRFTSTSASSLKNTSDDNKEEPIQPLKSTYDTNAQPIQPVISSTDETNTRKDNGLWTALRLGPPLIFKFLIVLLIKFATDLIVFPSLFLYRIVKIGLIKMVSPLKRKKNISSPKDAPMDTMVVNGDSTRSHVS